MIHIITINYNLSSDTIPCIESILKSYYQEIRILLIDNGSALEDFQKLEGIYGNHSKIDLLRIERNCGYVGGVNYGLRYAAGTGADYILVMNNDTIIDQSAIGFMLDSVQRHNNKAIVSGKVYYFDQPDVLQHTGVIFSDSRYLTTMYPGRNEKDIGQFDIEVERDSLDDVFWLFPVQLITDIGFYSDYFFLYAEQGDYAQRARRYGYKLIFTPEAKLWHKDSMTTGGGNSKALPVCYWRGQGRFIFQFRNLDRKYFLVFMAKNFLKYLVKSVVKKGDERKCIIATLRGYFYGFLWMFNKKPNDGYNPYVIKGK